MRHYAFFFGIMRIMRSELNYEISHRRIIPEGLVGVFSSFFKLFLGLLENKKKNMDFTHLSKTNIYILCPLF